MDSDYELRHAQESSSSNDGVTRAPETDRSLLALGNANLGALLGRGEPLNGEARIEMESRFGEDLSAVRVHTGERAAAAAREAEATAFAVGNDVVFSPGAYEPGSDAGKRVLAHEIAHTLQQRGAAVPSASLTMSAPADASEREADAMADAAMRGAHVPAPRAARAHLVRTPAPPAPTASSTTATAVPAGPMTRAQFEAEVLRRFGTADVHTGTLAEQRTLITRTGVVPNPGLTAAMWHSWDPGSSSAVYQAIIDGVLALSGKFGGIPSIAHIIFLEMSYELNSAGVAVARPDDGASYGAGTLTFYKHGAGISMTDRVGVPFARTSPSGNYPGGPVLGMSAPGDSPGAPIAVPTQSESVMRVIEHELGHGLAEAAMSPVAGTPPDPTMIDDYAKAVGWVGTGAAATLYDIGVPAVASAIAAGSTPPSASIITAPRWNEAAWQEQPISHYMVKGGPSEDFAEAVMAYVTAPAVLRARSPHRFAFIDTRKAKWTSRLTVPHP